MKLKHSMNAQLVRHIQQCGLNGSRLVTVGWPGRGQFLFLLDQAVTKQDFPFLRADPKLDIGSVANGHDASGVSIRFRPEALLNFQTVNQVIDRIRSIEVRQRAGRCGDSTEADEAMSSS